MGVISLMNSHKNLQTLIERAWGLHDKISDEIQYSHIGLGGFCSEHGGFAEVPFGERKRLIAIRDALEVLENMLLFLQRLQSRQQIDRHAALVQLEESRLLLIRMAAEHQGEAMEVIQAMLAFFGDENTTFSQNSNDPFASEVKNIVYAGGTRKRIACFLVSCFRVLNPWKWPKAAGLAVRFVVVSVSIVSMIQFHKTRQQISNSYSRKDRLLLNSAKIGQMGFLQTFSSSPLDVFHGRG